MKQNKIIQNYIYNLLYQFVMTILPMVTIPYLTRVLGSYNLGIARYTEAVVQLFTVFGLLGLVWYANRAVAYSRHDKEELVRCFWEIFIMRLILLALTMAVYIAVTWNSEYRNLYFIYSLYLAGTFLDCSWFFIGIEEMRPVAVRNGAVRIASALSLFLFVRSRDSLTIYVWILSLTLVANAVIIIPFLKPLIRAVPLHSLRVWSHFLPALSLFLPQAASQIYVQCDKLMIKYMIRDPSYISFYTENEKIAKMPIVLASALSTVLMPRIAFEFRGGNREAVKKYIRKAFLSTMLVLGPCCTGIMAVSNTFVPLFLGAEFAQTYGYLIMFSPIMIFIGLSNVTGIQYLVALDRTRELTISYISAALGNLLLDFLLIPMIGVYGAIIGTLFAESMVFVIQYYYMRQDVGSMHMAESIVLIMVSSAVMGIIVYLAGMLHMPALLKIVMQVLIGVIVYGAIMLRTGMIRQLMREG